MFEQNSKKNMFRFMVLFYALIVSMSLIITFDNNTIFASENTKTTAEEIEQVKAYCQEFGIDMSYDNEFIEEVQSMINERDEFGNINPLSSSSGGSGKKSRFIPTSGYADIIWTNNPSQPFNHVGLYTNNDKITESLKKGVKTRTVGKYMKEYPFNVYKVTKKSDPSSRYALSNRKKVTGWALKQVGKGYDTNFANNKQNTVIGNRLFNCSELVWKSWYFKMKVDLDSNGGPGVYPNNIKNSSRTKFITSG